MKANMNSLIIKKVIIKGIGWEDCHEIDSSIHEDFLLEAATRSFEQRRNDPDFKVSIMTEAWEKRNEKNPMKHYIYNTYFVLINASMYKQAENLRSYYKKKRNTDIKKLSLRGGDIDGKPANNN